MKIKDNFKRIENKGIRILDESKNKFSTKYAAKYWLEKPRHEYHTHTFPLDLIFGGNDLLSFSLRNADIALPIPVEMVKFRV